MLNVNLENFKKKHKRNLNQLIYYSSKTDGLKEIGNLINNFLNEKNSFVFESVEKGKIKGRYTILEKILTKFGNLTTIKVLFIVVKKKLISKVIQKRL